MSRLTPAVPAACIAWVGRAPPAHAAHPLVAAPTLEVAVALRPLPTVLVYDPLPGVDLSSQLATLGTSALAGFTVVAAIDHPDPEVLARLGAAGAFCALPRDSAPLALGQVLDLAVEHTRLQGLRREAARLAAEGGLLTRATFELRTLEEAEALATSVAACCPEPHRRVGGLLELLINAVEHGNLEISGARKRQLLEEGRWYAEVQARLEDPAFRARRVRLAFERSPDGVVTVSVEDEGQGFDWREVLSRELEDNDTRHGRGIALARLMSFDELSWEAQGRRAVARIRP